MRVTPKKLRFRWDSSTARRVGSSVEFAVGVCCRALVASGWGEVRGTSAWATWFVRAGARTPCGRGKTPVS